jgi:hypothetical protein
MVREPTVVTTTTTTKTGNGRRKPQENLKRVTEVVDVLDAVKKATGGEPKKLDITSSSLFVLAQYFCAVPECRAALYRYTSQT